MVDLSIVMWKFTRGYWEWSSSMNWESPSELFELHLLARRLFQACAENTALTSKPGPWDFIWGVSVNGATPIAGWFIRENPMKVDDNYRMGPPVDSVQLPYFSGFMVDIIIVNRAYFMVYKPTYNWGGPSCRGTPMDWKPSSVDFSAKSWTYGGWAVAKSESPGFLGGKDFVGFSTIPSGAGFRKSITVMILCWVFYHSLSGFLDFAGSITVSQYLMKIPRISWVPRKNARPILDGYKLILTRLLVSGWEYLLIITSKEFGPFFASKISLAMIIG